MPSQSRSPAPSARSSSLKPPNTGNRVRKTTSSREPPPPPPPFTPEMRDRMMELLAEETAAGNLSSTKAMQRRPAFKRVALAMAESFPAFGWSALKVQSKMRDEEKRYIQLLGVTRTPGNGYDEISGLPVASDAFWEGLLFEAPEEWLRVEPLGDVDHYDEVFPDLRDYG
ncbi:uncharacterized protein C8A04DRAFT_24431 [Dichotomopilus funicola]|uniref:Uncharacterized protein n=1 Tax=Dichotomopilus funicola TaxID=1934379 RepID=A0AAN6VAK3_9PEZI|nr:hypothetical protein C8A04DRAFT_24431 [Dichotomopilus funicola]